MNGYQIIKEASFAILNICGEQNFEPYYEYRISDFVITFEIDEGYLFHSCMTGELIFVTNIQYARLYLIKHWFFVRVGIDEKAFVSQIRKLMRCLKNNQKPGYKKIEIITTTSCNANCYYCYERHFKTMSMTIETAQKVIDFILNHRYNNKIHIKWYGGEPLMNIPIIDTISMGLVNTGIDLRSSMISNGYLFNKDIANKAKNIWNLFNVRITLDGTESVYNAIKRYNEKSINSFQKVIANIDALINNNISVTIRFNIEEYNIDDITLLIDYLCNKYHGNRLIDFMLRPLNNTITNHFIESTGKKRDDVLDRISSLQNNIYDAGFDINCGKLSGMTLGTCLADSGRYIMIKPNGELAYCSIDFDKQAFGNVFNKKQDIEFPNLEDYPIEKQQICDHCQMFPLCFPSKLCPSCIKPICDETQKAYNLADRKLIMKKMYRSYIKNNSYETKKYI